MKWQNDHDLNIHSQFSLISKRRQIKKNFLLVKMD